MLSRLNHYWYQPSFTLLTRCLLPFSWLFTIIVDLRRQCYLHGFLSIYHAKVPVIVVGNITVGGTGKTPVVMWLAKFLRSKGYRPGIVSRGVGGKKHSSPHWVTSQDPVNHVGDEALLIIKNTHCPMMIGTDRAACVRELIARTDCNVVISDDGLQHYKMGRDIEIALIDHARQLGNRALLPAGPLRELPSRLSRADFIIENGGHTGHYLELADPEFVSLHDGRVIAYSDFPHALVNAVAAIGHPQRFFTMLKKAGLNLQTHVFPDHHLYTRADFAFDNDLPIVMTEKDAIKCQHFADNRFWYLRVYAKLNNDFEGAIIKLLESQYENKKIPTRCSVNST